METEIIKTAGKYYYDGEITPGKLLSKSGENEIRLKKFGAVKIDNRIFVLDPTVEEFVSLQFREGKYEYIYKSGESFIVRDEEGNEIMPKDWLSKDLKVMTKDGIGTIETFTDNIALVKSANGLKNYYVNGLRPAEPQNDLQLYRNAWKKYEELLPVIKSEIRKDNTKLLKGAFDETFQKINESAPKKADTPAVNEPPGAPKTIVKPPAPDKQTKTGIVGKIKNYFSKKKPGLETPAPAVNVPEVNVKPEVNANHNLATPPPEVKTAVNNSSTPAHLSKQYNFTSESNLAGKDNHTLTHISLNPNSKADTDKYLYHYEVGDHKEPIVTDKYLDPSGNSQDHHGTEVGQPNILKSGIYVPGENVIDKTTGEEHEVVSHIDHNHQHGITNYNNMLVKDKDGKIKSIDRNNVQLSSADRTTHSIVNTESGNKHLHDLKVGDTINHEGHQHSVLFSDPKKGLGTVNQQTGKMNFVSAKDYHKPYLGEVKPVAKEGQTVQIGKKQYKIEHVGGDEKGTSILSHKDRLGNKEYFEHPTQKLHDKILKPADLQEYKGNRFQPKEYQHADLEGIDDAEQLFEQGNKHPDLKEDDIHFLKQGRGLTTEQINKMSPEEVQGMLSKKPGYKEPDKNPMPETPLPKPVVEEQKRQVEEHKKTQFDQTIEHLDKTFGEHNKKTAADGSVTHRIGIGDLGLKTTAGGSDVVNPEVTLNKNKAIIVKDIDPVKKTVTYRMKGDDPGDKKKYKIRSIEDFKTHVRENEKLEPMTDVEMKSNQMKHEDDFNSKVIEATSKHMHEKGIEPTKENIEKELQTSNGELRKKVEGYFNTYQSNHNKAKSKGSIVDHPEHEKLDIDKKLKDIEGIENHVQEYIGKNKEIQRGKLKDELSTDIAKEYHTQGKPYDMKPDAEATHEDFAKHRDLGGTDEEIHNEVHRKLKELTDRKKTEEEVEKSKQQLKEKQEAAKQANEERSKMSDQEYIDNIYNKKEDVKTKSLNESAGVKQEKGKLAFNNNPNYHNTEFEYHIVPRSGVTTSHTATFGDPKAPFTPNAEHPSAGQGREGYHSENIKGETDRKKVMDIAKNPEMDQLINTSRNASEQAPPIIDDKGNAINNGRFMAMDMTSDENKIKYGEHLKSQLPSLFPHATEEQHATMRDGIDEMIKNGDMPMLTRLPFHKESGEAYNLSKHGEDYGKFASATNDPNIKAMGQSEKIKAVQNALSDSDKKELFDMIPEGRTIGNHIKDVKNADKILDHLQNKGILTDTERSTFYGDDRRLNDAGKKYISDVYKNAYFDKEGLKLLDNNKQLGQKIMDFHGRHSDLLNEVKTHSKAYDLQHDIKDAFKSMVADKGQSEGQQSITEDSKTTKGLRYLIEHAQKGKDSAGNEFDDAHDALDRYTKQVRALKEGDGMFAVAQDEQDPKDFKEKFFDKYAKLYDQAKKIGSKDVSSEKSVEDLSNHPEASKYDKFPDKKTVSLDDREAFKGIHPDNIMHFNQGGANSKYGRVSFIAPSEHKFKKHEQYKKLAKEIREEGKDVLINAFKNPSIVAKLGKSFESFEDPLEKSHIDYKARIERMKDRKGRSVSSIAVMNGDKILMGKRRDNGKWTLPGGHAEDNENPHETGVRELEEETGIKTNAIKFIGEEVVSKNGNPLIISCFKYETNDTKTTMKDDPDSEVQRWHWCPTPLSDEILNNLHSPKNVTLRLLGLQDLEKSYAKAFMEKVQNVYNEFFYPKSAE